MSTCRQLFLPPLSISLSLHTGHCPLYHPSSLPLSTLRTHYFHSAHWGFSSRAHHPSGAMLWFRRLSLGLLLIDLAAAHVGTLVKIWTFSNDEEPDNMELKRGRKTHHHVESVFWVVVGGGIDWRLAGDTWPCPMFVRSACCVLNLDDWQLFPSLRHQYETLLTSLWTNKPLPGHDWFFLSVLKPETFSWIICENLPFQSRHVILLKINFIRVLNWFSPNWWCHLSQLTSL